MASLTSEKIYRHQPLPTDRWIRVLRLQPAPHLTAPIQCRLEEVSLDNPPSYWALSYSWDAQIPSEPISILGFSCDDGSHSHYENSVLKVTANCVAAMRRLRHADEERTIWIDGICIDQTSLAEKSSQVALMSEIYRVAERVVVWLGEGDGATVQSIQLLTSIGDFGSINSTNKSEQEFSVESKQRLQAAFQARAKELLREAACTSAETDKIGALFRRSWFTRMWTIQEVVFPSADKIHVHCGDATMTWLRLVAAVDCLGAIKYRWGAWQDAMRVQNYLTQMMLIRRFPDARRLMEGNPADRLRDLYVSVVMVRCREKAASDPADKALALYGLLGELGVTLPRPDYEKSIADIYAETTAACIEHDKIILVLYHVPSDTRRPGLPSWVPDWSDKGWNEGDSRYPITRGRFAASGGSDPKWKFGSDRRQLTVYGKIIDTVIYRAGSYVMVPVPPIHNLVTRNTDGRLTVSDELRSLHAMYQTFKEWVEVSGWAETYPTGEEVGDVLRRTLVNDEPRSVGLTSMHDFGDWLAAMRASEEELAQATLPRMPNVPSPAGGGGGGLFARLARRAVSALERQIAAVERQSLGLVDGEEVPVELKIHLALARRQAWGFHSLAIPFCSKKSFFRTSGGFLGTAPDKIPEPIQSEDFIAVVAGLAMPVVLRPDGSGCFRLISHCYLHGVMYGEVWERVGSHLDEIVLV